MTAPTKPGTQRGSAKSAASPAASHIVAPMFPTPYERIGHLQSSLTRIMRSEEIRSANLTSALKYLARMLTTELGIDRGGIVILNEKRTGANFSTIFDVATGLFQRHNAFKKRGTALLFLRTSGEDVVAVDDVHQPNKLSEFTSRIFDPLGIKSVVHAPVVSNGDVIGFVTATTTTRYARWRNEQLLFISGMANLVALTIEQADRVAAERLAKRTATRLREQQNTINAIIHNTIRAPGKPTMLLDAIADALFKHLKVDRITIRLSTDSESVPSYIREFGCLEPVQPDDSMKLGSIGWTPEYFAQLAKGPVSIEDCASHPYTSQAYKNRWRSRRTRSVIAAPIIVNDKLEGTVFCSSITRKRTWTPLDQLFVGNISTLLSMVYERERRAKTEHKLRNALLAKGRFLANMSHEIRTPMNGVLGVADLLSKTALNYRQSEFVNIIQLSAESLLSIINDILDVSRIESGALPIEAAEFDPAISVEQVVSLLADQAHQKGLQFELFIDNKTPRVLRSDAGRFRQILINIIGNAIKFTEQGGVTVRVSRQPIEGHAEGIAITIRDTGIGITSDVQDKLFKPFAQADSSISRRFGGTGLGLSIARDLAKLMGGELSLDSAKGVGTTVVLTLPIVTDAVATSPVDTDARPCQGVDIVIAGDKARCSIEAVEHYIEGLGASYRSTDDFASAICALEAWGTVSSHPVIGIFDWQMLAIDAVRLQHLAGLKRKLPHVQLVLLGGSLGSDEPPSEQSKMFSGFMNVPLSRSGAISMLTSMLAPDAPPVQQQPEAPVAPAVTLPWKILFAEDNRINRLVAKEFLGKYGCQITFANDGLEAVSAFETDTFDLVMMDCQMPNLDGMSATRQIREVERKGARVPTPIIAVTANAYEQDRIDCLLSGMDDYISKPYTEQQLVDAIKRWKPHEAR